MEQSPVKLQGDIYNKTSKISSAGEIGNALRGKSRLYQKINYHRRLKLGKRRNNVKLFRYLGLRCFSFDKDEYTVFQ